MPPNNVLCKHVGSLLVTLQFAFIALLAVPTASAFVKLRAPTPACALAMLGMLIGWRALQRV
jgi:xanthosine utilization system XapX-like protein